MDVFGENLRRHQAEQGRGIGGSYGMAPAPILGWHPSPSLVFFDDWTLINDANPSTNYWKVANDGYMIRDLETVSDPRRKTHAYFSSMRPFKNPRHLHFPTSGIRCLNDASVNMSADISITFIRVPLAAAPDPLPPSPFVRNPYGIDLMTWNLGGVGGSIFSNPDNYVGPVAIMKVIGYYNGGLNGLAGSGWCGANLGNGVPFGKNSYGIDTDEHTYFGIRLSIELSSDLSGAGMADAYASHYIDSVVSPIKCGPGAPQPFTKPFIVCDDMGTDP